MCFVSVLIGDPSCPSSLTSDSAIFSETLASSFFTSWIGRLPVKDWAPSLRSFIGRQVWRSGRLTFKNQIFFFFHSIADFCGPAMHDQTSTSPRTDMTRRSSTGQREPPLKETNGFWLLAWPRLLHLFVGSLNEPTTLANFFCRSIRSTKILA